MQTPWTTPTRDHTTGLVLAGGQGSRMGGRDKGLQLFAGQPLAYHALQRLQPQVSRCLVSANRHLDHYTGWGVPVLPDQLPDHLPPYPGPLAGFLTGLTHCSTPWLLTVPCDSPFFPLDLAQRLAACAHTHHARLVLAAAPDATGQLRPQPTFALLHRSLAPSLADFLQQGGIALFLLFVGFRLGGRRFLAGNLLRRRGSVRFGGLGGKGG